MNNQPIYIKDMLNLARTSFIDWMLDPNKTTSKNLMDEITKIADELDITESAALEMVKGNDDTN
jgi:hypothetical protein